MMRHPTLGIFWLGLVLCLSMTGCGGAGTDVQDPAARHGDSHASKRNESEAGSPRRRTPVDPSEEARAPERSRPDPVGAAVPEKVIKVLRSIDKHARAPEGYEGGRIFHNSARNGEQPLPHTDADGRPIAYREWDVNPKTPGVNRGAERLVTGSDGSAYYTADHYRTFIKIR
jgi:guanyl-specific ribonuclease Sa